MQFVAGTLLADRYLLERELGRGGMATVWLARDQQHDRQVAIKILHPELAGAIGLDRFIREVRITAGLQHPNIVPVFDSGVLRATDGHELPWCAMALVDGESLRVRMTREQQLPIDEALRITKEVAAALHSAHRNGVVHRDIKPENVLLSGERVFVLDFGIAKALESQHERLTSTGIAMGTPAYMSPEQALGSGVDARTDQYSLAAVLYEMLAGEPPFSGPSAQAVIARRLAEPARPLAPVRSTVPAHVERAVLRALERAPADRFADLAAFTAALSGATSGYEVKRHRRNPLRTAIAATVILGAVAAAWLLSAWRGRPHAVDPEVIALVQRGMREYDRRTPEGIVEAITSIKAAIARDSTYSLAWSALARAFVRAEEREFGVPGYPRTALIQQAVLAVDRALALDTGNADAWITRGIVGMRLDPTDYGSALRAIRRGMAVDSNNAPAWHFLARMRAETGDMDGALDAWRRSVRADPTYTLGVAFLAMGHYWRHNYDSAAYWADSAVALEPAYLLGRTVLGQIAVERGEFARATAAFEAARRLATGVEAINALAGLALIEARAGRSRAARDLLQRADSLLRGYAEAPLHNAVFIAHAYAALGETPRAVAWLERYAPRVSLHFQLHLRCDPAFAPIADDPRFRSLITDGKSLAATGC